MKQERNGQIISETTSQYNHSFSRGLQSNGPEAETSRTFIGEIIDKMASKLSQHKSDSKKKQDNGTL